MSLRTILSNYGFVFQRELFPTLEEELGPLGERYELFVTVLGFVPDLLQASCLGRATPDRFAHTPPRKPHCRWIVAAQKCCRCPDDVSDAETSPNIKSEYFALDVPLGFCKWLRQTHLQLSFS